MISKEFTILFIDDEPWLNEGLRLILETKGMNCISTDNVDDALKYIKKEQISVIVTDIMMPGGSAFPDVDSSETGFHFVSKIRKEWPDIAIICLSVIGDQDKIKALKRKNVLYLRKGETPIETAVSLIESRAKGEYTYW